MDNMQKYRQVFQEVFGVAPEALDGSFTFGAVDKWDSMAHMELISRLEETFDVFFETKDILGYGSYENGMRILRGYGVDI